MNNQAIQPDCTCLRCPNCDGEGRYEALVPRFGYRMGPDLVEAWVTCPQCDGTGRRFAEDCAVHTESEVTAQ